MIHKTPSLKALPHHTPHLLPQIHRLLHPSFFNMRSSRPNLPPFTISHRGSKHAWEVDASANLLIA
jgi:hypothetical protein